MLRLSIARFLTLVGGFFLTLAKRIVSPRVTPFQLELERWARAGGDRTLRLHYDLNKNSCVFDIGGYKGQWASDIFAMYGCRIHVFEPVPEFVKFMEQRFSRNKKIVVHNYGLSNITRKRLITLNDDSSSAFKEGDRKIHAVFVDIFAFLRKNHVLNVDLMKINVEGCEYDILDRLIDTGLVSCVGNIQVQFHNFVPNSGERMRQIQARLIETHEPTYQFLYVWENWKRRRRSV